MLPPGLYVLTVDVGPAFAVSRDAEVSVGAGETVELTVVLTLAGVSESITVQPSSEISTRTSGIESRFTSTYIREIPPRRSSMFSLINRVFPTITRDLIADVLNVLNDTAEEAIVSDSRFSATFAAPRLFIDPRRAMFGVRMNLGR